MVIEELERFSQQDYLDLHELMKELSERVELTQLQLLRVLRDENAHLFVMRSEEGRIVGSATLCIYNSLSGTKAMVEDVTVASCYRGRHLGRQLMEHVVTMAREEGPLQLFLTSKPKRIVANQLYLSLGFERKETNCYVMSGE